MQSMSCNFRYEASGNKKKKTVIISVSLFLSKCLLASIKQRNQGSCWLEEKETGILLYVVVLCQL